MVCWRLPLVLHGAPEIPHHAGWTLPENDRAKSHPRETLAEQRGEDSSEKNLTGIHRISHVNVPPLWLFQVDKSTRVLGLLPTSTKL